MDTLDKLEDVLSFLLLLAVINKLLSMLTALHNTPWTWMYLPFLKPNTGYPVALL